MTLIGCLPDVRRSLLGNGYGCGRRRQRSNTLRHPGSRDVHVPRRPARGRQRRVDERSEVNDVVSAGSQGQRSDVKVTGEGSSARCRRSTVNSTTLSGFPSSPSTLVLRHGPGLGWKRSLKVSQSHMSPQVSVTDRVRAGCHRSRRRKRRTTNVQPESLRVPRLGERTSRN